MKIPLEVSPEGRVTKVVSIQVPRGFQFVTFVIDTGSTNTFLSEKDAMRLKIPIKDLKEVKKLVSLSGKPFSLLFFRKVKINLRTETGEIHSVNWPIYLRSYSKHEKFIYVKELPSILGTDFIKENKFTLYYNPAKSIAYFEIEE